MSIITGGYGSNKPLPKYIEEALKKKAKVLGIEPGYLELNLLLQGLNLEDQTVDEIIKSNKLKEEFWDYYKLKPMEKDDPMPETWFEMDRDEKIREQWESLSLKEQIHWISKIK